MATIRDIINGATGGNQGPQSYASGIENYVPVPPYMNSAPVAPASTPVVGTATAPTRGMVTPPATPTTPAAPTVGTALGFSSGNYNAYPTYDKLYGKPVDENAIQRNQMQQFQSEIDATNKIYDAQLAQERITGQGRQGSTTAMDARAGNLGSDFSAAHTNDMAAYNTGQLNAIQAERIAKIAGISANIRTATQAAITEKRNARQQGAENYINYLTGASSRKEKNLSSIATDMIDQGINPTKLAPKETAQIAKDAGVSTQEILASYMSAKKTYDAKAAKTVLDTTKTQAEINKINSDIASGKLLKIGEGDMLYNTETGKTFKNPKTYAPGTGTTGTFKSGSLVATPQDISTIAGHLNSGRGSDGYANTGTYIHTINELVAQGALLQDVVKKFPPDLFLNPSDPTLPAWIKTEMNKPLNPMQQYYQSLNSSAGEAPTDTTTQL